jgi:hypothetical protein
MFFCGAMADADIALALEAAEASFKSVKASKAALKPHPTLMAMFEARR